MYNVLIKGDNMNNDQKLYMEFINGNQKSFEMIIDKYMEKLVYFINSFVNNIDAAEDLAQDVYILINKKQYDFKYSLKTYLFTIGKCRAFNYIKKEKKLTVLEENICTDDYENIEDIVFQNERHTKLRKTINKLNPSQSRVVFLADIEELSYKDICQILDMSMPQVKSLLHRGRKKLKEIILKEANFYHE